MPLRSFIFLLVSFFCASAWPNTKESKSVHLALEKDGTLTEAVEKLYDFPILMVQSAERRTSSVESLSKAASGYFDKGKLSFKRSWKGSQPLVTREQLKVPRSVKKGNQRKMIADCQVSKCEIKLNSVSEVKKLERAKNKVKLHVFQGLILSRIQEFLNQRFLRGYAQRYDNRPYVQSGIERISSIKKNSPTVYGYFQSGLFGQKDAPETFRGSHFREEIIFEDSNVFQPTWRIAEVFHFEDKKSKVWVEVYPYNNHYFDSALTVLEIFPDVNNKGKSIIVFSEVMEIDELKSSSIARFLHKDKIEASIADRQKAILKEIQ